eukprot:gnl/TRDRNA2_/TRDRNA2_188015_c0_seq1.p1 gnl/TRDRNA2_/TRDRNA2_188015_c0~~gnl/TRDRNA2_/TRDRNA2_188015_c0_seq1.p1  ORF type:complete len:359 (+),score=52.95 gnl/TRDRNA2_/TRDRNA2_188015_c0_seq1:31-1107(+)
MLPNVAATIWALVTLGASAGRSSLLVGPANVTFPFHLATVQNSSSAKNQAKQPVTTLVTKKKPREAQRQSRQPVRAPVAKLPATTPEVKKSNESLPLPKVTLQLRLPKVQNVSATKQPNATLPHSLNGKEHPVKHEVRVPVAIEPQTQLKLGQKAKLLAATPEVKKPNASSKLQKDQQHTSDVKKLNASSRLQKEQQRPKLQSATVGNENASRVQVHAPSNSVPKMPNTSATQHQGAQALNSTLKAVNASGTQNSMQKARASARRVQQAKKDRLAAKIEARKAVGTNTTRIVPANTSRAVARNMLEKSTVDTDGSELDGAVDSMHEALVHARRLREAVHSSKRGTAHLRSSIRGAAKL